MVFVRGCNYSLGNNNPALTKSTVMLMKPVGMLIGDNCSHKASQLQYLGFTTGQKVCCLYLSCLGAKDRSSSGSIQWMRVGQGEVGGVTYRMLCIWWLLGLALKRPWLAPGGPAPFAPPTLTGQAYKTLTPKLHPCPLLALISSFVALTTPTH